MGDQIILTGISGRPKAHYLYRGNVACAVEGCKREGQPVASAGFDVCEACGYRQAKLLELVLTEGTEGTNVLHKRPLASAHDSMRTGGGFPETGMAS